jgi:integrase
LKKLGMQDKCFHDLRRTVATDAIEAGVPEQVVMAITGHKTRAVFQRYHIVKSDAVRDGMARMQSFRERG